MALAIAWSAASAPRRLIYPVVKSELIVQPFEIPRHWKRGYGLVAGPGATAAIWGALDPQSNILYLYDEYCGVCDRSDRWPANLVEVGCRCEKVGACELKAVRWPDLMSVSKDLAGSRRGSCCGTPEQPEQTRPVKAFQTKAFQTEGG